MADSGAPSFLIRTQPHSGEIPHPTMARGFAPWRGTDLLRLSVTAVLGVALLVTSWYGAARQGAFDKQSPWIDLGIVAGIVFGAGNCVWVLQGRRRIGERRNRLIPFTAEAVDLYRWRPVWNTSDQPPASGAAVAPTNNGRGDGLVRAEGMRFAHRPNCPLVDGKTVSGVRGNSWPRCLICHPESP